MKIRSFINLLLLFLAFAFSACNDSPVPDQRTKDNEKATKDIQDRTAKVVNAFIQIKTPTSVCDYYQIYVLALTLRDLSQICDGFEKTYPTLDPEKILQTSRNALAAQITSAARNHEFVGTCTSPKLAKRTEQLDLSNEYDAYLELEGLDDYDGSFPLSKDIADKKERAQWRTSYWKRNGPAISKAWRNSGYTEAGTASDLCSQLRFGLTVQTLGLSPSEGEKACKD